MPILLAGTIKFVHIEQVSALFKYRLGQVSLYYTTAIQIFNTQVRSCCNASNLHSRGARLSL
jgi:hypothetical protein